ncbi:DUF1345 domain-containing protein [Streptomyces sp. NPDC093097]|uniref:DUF1345 domain-containing protein n=1 Tax=Streptomyces sp. NPDC093097 TaxID=3366027 RepID=UPI0037F14C42
MHSWLSERRRAAVSTLLAICAVGILLLALSRAKGPSPFSTADMGVSALFVYLLCYLTATLIAFSTASPERIRTWAQRESRGTPFQRYVLGAAPGPGASIFIAEGALVVSVVWRPGYLGSAFPMPARVLVALALVVAAWICVLVSFAVAFHADNLVENEQASDFPGENSAAWADYVYFAMSVMTTFGATDVTVTSREMRRTVAFHSVIAYVFNTVTVASLVASLGGT